MVLRGECEISFSDYKGFGITFGWISQYVLLLPFRGRKDYLQKQLMRGNE